MFECNESSSASNAGLDFVNNQKCSVQFAKSCGFLQISIINFDACFPLNGLHNKCCKFPCSQRVFKSGKIIDWDALRIAKCSKSIPQVWIPICRESAERQAVKSFVAVQDSIASSKAPR